MNTQTEGQTEPILQGLCTLYELWGKKLGTKKVKYLKELNTPYFNTKKKLYISLLESYLF